MAARNCEAPLGKYLRELNAGSTKTANRRPLSRPAATNLVSGQASSEFNLHEVFTTSDVVE